MNHYFSDDPTTESNQRTISLSFRGQEYSFLTDDGVFSKGRLDYGSEVMLDAVLDDLSGKVLDLGCGYGPIGVLMKLLRPLDVTMVDVNPRAVELSRLNLKKHRQKATVLQSDGFDKVRDQFDFILLNPPIRAGKAVMYRLYNEAYDHLNPGGSLIIVIQKKHGADSSKKKLVELFGQAETVERSGGYHVIKATKSALADRNVTDHEVPEDDH